MTIETVKLFSGLKLEERIRVLNWLYEDGEAKVPGVEIGPLLSTFKKEEMAALLASLKIKTAALIAEELKASDSLS